MQRLKEALFNEYYMPQYGGPIPLAEKGKH